MANPTHTLSFLFIITTCVVFCGPVQNSRAASSETFVPPLEPAELSDEFQGVLRGTWFIDLDPANDLQQVRDPDQLARLCARPKPVYACTKMVTPILTCNCRREADSWYIDAHARLRPEMIMRDRMYLRHENLHLADMRERLAARLEKLVTRRFSTYTDCLRAQGMAIYTFRSLLSDIALASTIAIDGPQTIRASR